MKLVHLAVVLLLPFAAACVSMKASDSERVAQACSSKVNAKIKCAPAQRNPNRASAATTAADAPELVFGAGGRPRGAIDCQGREVTVNSRANTVTLRGKCTVVTITGTGNRVVVAQPAAISVSGRSNNVAWTSRGEGARNTIAQVTQPAQFAIVPPAVASAWMATTAQSEPELSVDLWHGAAKVSLESIVAAAKTPAVGTPRLADTSFERNGRLIVQNGIKDRVLDCGGKDVLINGGRNRLVLRGVCNKVNILGAHNDITLEGARIVNVPGSFNRLAWQNPSEGKLATVAERGKL
jgi:Protein of unknown function (DUF3060)